jgi:prophage tail gpP-like protein
MIDVSVNGENISYSKISVSKSIETASGMFSITICGGKLQYKYRDTVEIFISGSIVLKGKIERIDAYSSAEANEYVYAGRDNTGDFIDSSFDTVVEFNRSLNLDKIITDLSSPFGITVKSEVSVANFTTGELPTAYAGQNIFEFCDKLCRIRSVLLTSSDDGGLLITDEGVTKNDKNIVFGGDYSNAFERSYFYDHTKEFEKYVVYSQNNSTLDDLNNLVNVKAIDGAGTRTKTLIENNSLHVGECLARARFERDIDKRKAMRYTVKVSGHPLYKRNELVNVKDTFLAIDETMLIVSVQYMQTSDQSYTQLVMERQP